MSKQYLSSELPRGVIPFHFDVDEHTISLSQFVLTAKAFQTIVDNFNRQIFDDTLNYKIVVLPPEKGGFIGFLEFVIENPIVNTAATLAILENNIVKNIIKELTGHTAAEWSIELTKGLKTTLSKIDEGKRKKLLVGTFAFILANMAINFVELEPSTLDTFGLSGKNYRQARIAKNEIFQACIDNVGVQAIGFDTSHNFPIKRNDFPKYISPIPLIDEELDIEWVVEIVTIKVNSPNWKRGSKRQWQGDTETFKEVNFLISDDDFWLKVEQENINPNINDVLKVQWAYPKSSGKKPHNIQVLKVITFNDIQISKPLALIDIENIFAEIEREPDNPQGDLFNLVNR